MKGELSCFSAIPTGVLHEILGEYLNCGVGNLDSESYHPVPSKRRLRSPRFPHAKANLKFGGLRWP